MNFQQHRQSTRHQTLALSIMAFLRSAAPRRLYAYASCYYSYTVVSGATVHSIGFKKCAFHSSKDVQVRSIPNIHKLSIRNFSKEYKIAQAHTPSDAIVESQTMDWIRKVVIGYNLCPFAAQPLRENRLNITVVRGDDPEWIASTVLHEMIYHSEKPGTTVVVAPEYYPEDFELYMSLVQYLEEEVLDESDDLRGVVQIAPFHPLFQFEGSGSDGVDNYTNRGPYPMFHILREDEVAGAVQKLGGDASKVWERNVRLLESMELKLGRDGVEKAMRGETVDQMDELLKDIKVQD
jgi:hypothetical protein